MVDPEVLAEYIKRQALIMRVFAVAVDKTAADMRQFAERLRFFKYEQRARAAARHFRSAIEWKQQS